MQKSSGLKVILLTSIFLVYAAGCQENASPEPTRVINKETHEAEELLEELEPITTAVAITSGKKLYAAAEVKQMDRFQLESVRKKGYDRLSNRWPDYNIHFSTDKKAMLELQNLNKDMSVKKMKKKEREQRLTKIEEFMKG
ncbi:hypothetical protein [Alteribacillus bidgolensis]|uniref:Sporulation lipoprotein YhcN/YlaJ (Spore_YhcN_YlaJ) n=1 Tax=Alteribacillus bidgolensis TaxID=930129 RepID=A0A1G8BYI9_9BACI|nr:hypothetical protein [Alteribacillus bidgolensis]SDH38194.1 hypothetical protein SAMN05216352_101126 [Alteribacillus bidgolensis]